MQTLIFLNGEIPGKKIIGHFIKERSFVIAADGGCNYLRKERLLPDVIIGDMDSANKKSVKYFSSKGTEILKINEQETTDFEKSLLYCKSKKLSKIFVFGFSSMRIDHTVNNFSILKRYSGIMDITMIDEEFEVFMINKSTSIKYKKNEIFSFVAMPKAFNIYTKGLRYKLKGENLEFGVREGSLNISTSGLITLNFDKGVLLIFKKHFL